MVIFLPKLKIVDCFDCAYNLTDNLVNKTMKTFLEEYDCADILCIDNILFLAHKEATQKCLVEIIDNYISENRVMKRYAYYINLYVSIDISTLTGTVNERF